MSGRGAPRGRGGSFGGGRGSGPPRGTYTVEIFILVTERNAQVEVVTSSHMAHQQQSSVCAPAFTLVTIAHNGQRWAHSSTPAKVK